MGNKFTEKEIAILKEHYETMRNQDIVDQFLPHRNKNQIKKKAASLGLKKDIEYLKALRTSNIEKQNDKRNRRFTEDELSIIKEHYPQGGSRLCRKYLPDRSKQVINNKARELGLEAPALHPDLWEVDMIAQSKDNPYSVTVVYRRDGV